MVRTLILVRHGKAEKAPDDSSDLYRELTPDGRHALEIAYPRTFSLLEDYDDVNVWSSPAIRAMQTAQVVANVLGVVLGDERAQMSQYMDEIQRDLGALCNARTNATLADEFRHSPRFRGVRADLGVAGRDQSEVVSAIVSGMKRREASDEAAEEGALSEEAPAADAAEVESTAPAEDATPETSAE